VAATCLIFFLRDVFPILTEKLTNSPTENIRRNFMQKNPMLRDSNSQIILPFDVKNYAVGKASLNRPRMYINQSYFKRGKRILNKRENSFPHKVF